MSHGGGSSNDLIGFELHSKTMDNRNRFGMKSGGCLVMDRKITDLKEARIRNRSS
jgi:hypothetical protein